MKDYEVSIIPIIEANYDRLTTVEKSIADFFISNVDAVDLSAKGVADKLFVSEASLSRFAKKIGFSGYREFIYNYQSTFVQKPADMQEDTKVVLNTYQDLLDKSYSLVDNEQIRRVVGYLFQKKRIYVYGFGCSGLAAEEFKIRFMRMGLDVEAVTDFHLMMLNDVRVDSDSLVIAISVSGLTKEVIEALERAAEKKAATILMTSRNDEKFTDVFDEVILMAVKQNLEYGNVISPQFPILIMIDIIYRNFLLADKGQKQATYDETVWKIVGRYV